MKCRIEDCEIEKCGNEKCKAQKCEKRDRFRKWDVLEKIIGKALDRLYEEDGYLISTKTAERTVVYRFAIYMREELMKESACIPKCLHLDVEYNRYREEADEIEGSQADTNSQAGTKRQVSSKHLANSKNQEDTNNQDDSDGNTGGSVKKEETVVPDLILHQRGTSINNILVIEFKTHWNAGEEKVKEDIEKIEKFCGHRNENRYQYQYGVTAYLGKYRNDVEMKRMTNVYQWEDIVISRGGEEILSTIFDKLKIHYIEKTQ